MTKVKKLFSLVMIIAIIASMFSFSPTVAYASTNGKISSLSNTSSGIKVSWSKDSSKTGYNIYRKAGNEKSFKKVKQITKNSTLSWVDKNVKNGTKYVYKVRAYKGSKVASTTATKTIYYVSKAKLSSVSRASSTSVKIKSSKNSSVTGFQVKYSTSADFSGSKTLNVKGTAVNSTLTKLTKGRRYYVKARAYITINGKTYYGVYSDVSEAVTYYTAYTTNIYTSIYDKPDSDKGKKTTLRYMSKVSMYEVVKSYSHGKYQKLKYNGKYYYAWLPAGVEKFTTTKNPYDYSNATSNPYAQEVIDKAVYIFKNWDTKYVHDQSTGIKDKDGKYGFDCSGFAGYLFNTVMRQYVPTYRISQNIEKIAKTDVIYNNGFSTEFSAKTVCSGKLDFSKLQPGDVIFYDLPSADPNKSPNHCVIYLGQNQFIHSTSDADGVEILPFMDAYADNNCFKKAVRFVPDKVEEVNKVMKIKDPKYNTVKVYSTDDAKSENIVESISNGTEVTILYTRADYAYVKYNGNKKGFLYSTTGDILDKLV